MLWILLQNTVLRMYIIYGSLGYRLIIVFQVALKDRGEVKGLFVLHNEGRPN